MDIKNIIKKLEESREDKRNTVSICINVPISFRDKLKKYSEKKDLSISKLFRTIMTELLNDKE